MKTSFWFVLTLFALTLAACQPTPVDQPATAPIAVAPSETDAPLATAPPTAAPGVTRRDA